MKTDWSCTLTYNQEEIQTKAESVLVGNKLGTCPDAIFADDWSKSAKAVKWIS